MPTRSNKPDASASADTPAFAGLGAGFDFFQQWMKAASSAMPGMGSAATKGATAWAMPTLDPEELEKRIQELKTVQFWLEQNSRMLGVTIQTLEVQRMTLNTLKGMKVPMDALRESLRAQAPFAAGPAPAETPAVAPQAPAPDTEAASGPADTPTAAVNPMQWWSTLTEQFSTLASQAVQASQDAMHAATGAAASASGDPVEGSTGAQTDAAGGEEPTSGSDAAPPRARPAAPAARPRAATQTVPRATGGKTPRR